ncbi:Cyanovirin-N [Dactylella cylindrospora]|nr:Cyanovirin-N [Dactylella cylindrospora]
MLHSSLFLLVASLCMQTVQASLSSDCINIRLQNTWLVADCRTGSGNTRIQSSVYLQTKLVNIEGVLGWQVNGNYAASCKDCSIVAPATLSCLCKPTWGQHIPASINLQDHINSYSGHMLSDLAGPPTPPTTTSTLSIPADLSWQLWFGNTTCYSTTTSFCPVPPVGGGETCSQYPSVSSLDWPANCFAFRYPVSTPVWGTYGSAKVNAPSAAYVFEFYDNLQCSGPPAGTISPNELGSCKEFRHQMIAVSAVPLWNGQV